MKVRMLAASVALAALSVPAFASSVIHNANNEMGYTTHPDHATQGLTRAQVLDELKAAQKSPAWPLMRIGVMPDNFKSTLSRAEVRQDTLRAMQQPGWDGRNLDAPEFN